MVVQCCVCKRVHLKDTWEHVLDQRAIAATASHGYCPTCLDNAYAQFDTLQRSAVASASAA